MFFMRWRVDDLVFARALMGTSLVFFIVYMAISNGLPQLIAETLSRVRKQEIYHPIARLCLC